MTRRFALLICLSFALSSLLGCGKSVEGETKRWDANQLSVQEYTAKYPGFKRALEERLAAGKAAMTAAKGLSGDAKAKAMSVANEKVNVILFRFRAVERKMREYDTLKRDRDLRRLPMGMVRPAMESAEGAVRRTRRMLKTSNPTNAGEAIGRLKSAERLLSKAFTPLKNLQKKMRKAKSKARKAKKAGKKSTQGK
jgi:ASC-1-like (ASCH) protein